MAYSFSVFEVLEKNNANTAMTLYFLERKRLQQCRFCNKYETTNCSYTVVSLLWRLVIPVIKEDSMFPDKALF